MDGIYSRIEDPNECGVLPDGESDIQKFYAGQTVFLTGSTGFLGKIVVEKLLRSCPDMKRLYILVRPKKQWTIEQRMTRYFEGKIFDRLKETIPDFQDKVVPLQGELALANLGLSDEDWNTLTKETNIIIHNAATVKFDEKLSIALRINVLGTKEMLELALQCENMKVFTYVSTAYSHCYQKESEEKFYTPPADIDVVYDMIAADENPSGLSEEGLKILLGKWPNTYSFTKAIAEGIVQEYSERANFSISVFRPSIVVSTFKEPIRGWCGNLNGPTAGFTAACIGVLHVVWASPDSIMDYIPVDMCANALLASSWDVAMNRENIREPSIYNYGTSTWKPNNVVGMQSLLRWAVMEKPSNVTLWFAFMTVTDNCWVYFALDILTHVIPCALVDCARMIQFKKPMAIPTYLKIRKYLSVVEYFCFGRWQFYTVEMQKVWDRMSPVDSELFFCDIRKFEWEDFGLTYWTGLRTYVVKDPLDSLEEARPRFMKLKILHYIVSILFLLSILYFSYVIGRSAICYAFN